MTPRRVLIVAGGVALAILLAIVAYELHSTHSRAQEPATLQVARVLPPVAPYRTDPSDPAISQLSDLSIDDAVWKLRLYAAGHSWPFALAEQVPGHATVVISDTNPPMIVSIADDPIPGTPARTLVRIERARVAPTASE